MEQCNDYETVYFVSTPFVNREEEIATSFIVGDDGNADEEHMEYEVLVDETVAHEIAEDEHGENYVVAVVEEEYEHAVDVTDQVNNDANFEEANCDTHVEEQEECDVNVEHQVISVEEHHAGVEENSRSVEEHELEFEEQVENLECSGSIDDTEIELAETEETELSGLEQLYAAAKVIPKPNYDKYTCQYCSKKFTKPSNRMRHVRRVHKVVQDNYTYIKCLECNLGFPSVTKLRDHLTSEHNMVMSEQELRFPNINAFKKWKYEIERKELCSFTMRHGARHTPKGPRYLYACHRSGRYSPKLRGPRQRMLKAQGTCKMGIICTAAISCTERPNEVIVKYHPNHYGHGRETSFIQLSSEEQNAIQESVSKGVPFEKLLDDIRDSTSPKDHFQLYLLKRKDIRWINAAFNAEEYNPGISDAESVDRWVRLCCQMENSPILFYRQEEYVNDQEEFMLIIMTEYQKHILLSSSKEVICVDSIYRRKGGRFYLTVLFIMDEYDLAFPVAFCISNKVDKNVILCFFHALYESTGPLSAKYFMSDSETYYFDAWKEIMNDDSKWLWSMWYVDNKIRVQLRIFRGNTTKRAEVYQRMRMLLECQNQDVFTCMFDTFIDSLINRQETKDLGNFIQQHYGSNPEMWAYCYRRDINLSTNIHLEVMHRTFRYCCREGRKKRLDKFIFVLMKLVRNKMLDRLTNVLDDEKISLAKETISVCHSMGLEIPSEDISSLSDKIWLIRSENEEENVYVIRENETCPELCNLKCEECDICVHMYSCSCVHSLINANLCHHIHAVVWKFLTPHFSPPPSPENCSEEFENDSVPVIPDSCTELLESVLKRTHEVYKRVQSNKCNLSKDSLSAVMKRLNECVDICSGKKFETENKPAATQSATTPNTVLIVSPYAKKNATQPFILPNQLPTLLQNKHANQIAAIVQSNQTSQLANIVQNSQTNQIAAIVQNNHPNEMKNNGQNNETNVLSNAIRSGHALPQYVLIVPKNIHPS